MASHEVETAFERGWSHLTNGELLKAAEAANFDLIVTTDQNLRYQQNLSERRIAVLVLSTTNWRRIRQHVTMVSDAIDRLVPQAYIEVEIPSSS